MVACLKKTEGNSDFHEIVDFLTSSLIHHALTINATIDSKAVVVTEASIRSSLLFNDADDSRESLEGTNGNEGDQVQTPHDSPLLGGHTSDRAEGAPNLQELSILCTNLSNRVLALESIKDAQAAEISALKIRIKKLEKKCKPSISHHRAWLKSMPRLSMKKRFGKKEFVSKQGRKKSKPESTLDDSTVFDDQDADHGMEPEVSTARPDIDAARLEDSVVKPKTPPTTTSIFDDEDITMASKHFNLRLRQKKLNPKDKGKGVLKESPVKKVKRSDLDAAQIAKDAKIARLVHEKELAEMEREREEQLKASLKIVPDE
ncbi:hypothetical protein Tco_0896117 [Tanacetum coccineum]